MGIKVDPAELRRWEAAGLVPPDAGPRRSSLPPSPPGPVARHHHEDGGPGWRVTLTLPGLTLVSRSNAREHWAARHRRDRTEAAAVRAVWHAAGLAGWRPPLPLAATLTRIGGRPFDDDNLAGAFKAIRDAVAGLLAVDDGDDRVRWRVRQKPGPAALVRLALAGGPPHAPPRG